MSFVAGASVKQAGENAERVQEVPRGSVPGVIEDGDRREAGGKSAETAKKLGSSFSNLFSVDSLAVYGDSSSSSVIKAFFADPPSVATIVSQGLDAVIQPFFQAVLPLPHEGNSPRLGEASPPEKDKSEKLSNRGLPPFPIIQSTDLGGSSLRSPFSSSGSGTSDLFSRLSSILFEHPQVLLLLAGHLLLFAFVFLSRCHQGAQLFLLFFLSVLLFCSKDVSEVCVRLLYNYPESFAFCRFLSLDTEDGHNVLFLFWCVPLLACLGTLSGLLVWDLVTSLLLLTTWKKKLALQKCQRKGAQTSEKADQATFASSAGHGSERAIRARLPATTK
ncbi:hypothetical protein BESB_061110 [Besnoitia besnoiti]|uniref:Transmembrane protein n=1 Tax=Besnoitia besnoiti TaxID=94643 RepID=A0A2A9MDE3_BESBE|nr:hypothetical protein BESB_061110 [Besnoitia besnoiti]PFH35224.1 hypothetical protein BESB_061110 [Besnoitia besnoiti]